VTSASASLANPTRTTSAAPARIRFRQPVSPVGYIDAAWWPRSRELATELTPVLAQLAAEGRRIARVIYDLNYWTSTSRRLVVGGQLVRLGGFSTDEPRLISFIEASGRGRIDVLIIDPDTDPAVAEKAMALASQSGNLLRPAEVLEQASP
jgi:hypothetical protein